MWSFSASDLSEGAQEKVVAAADFKGPKKPSDRNVTNFSCIPLLVIGLLFCGFCVVVPSFFGSPNYMKLLVGTDYNGTLHI